MISTDDAAQAAAAVAQAPGRAVPKDSARAAAAGRPAARLQRPTWRDPRLVAGISLVALAGVLGSLAVSSARNTTAMYAAARDLPVGTVLSEDDLAIREVALDSAADAYVSLESGLAAGKVLTRPIGSGELVPVSALVDANASAHRVVSVPLNAGAAAALMPGAPVQVWSGAPVEGSADYTPPEVLIPVASVYSMATSSANLGQSAVVNIQLAIPVESVSVMLEAIANRHHLSVVPLPYSADSGVQPAFDLVPGVGQTDMTLEPGTGAADPAAGVAGAGPAAGTQPGTANPTQP